MAATAAAASGGGDQKDVSSLIVKAVDETKNVKRGGTYKTRGTFEPSTLDPHQFPNNFYVYQTYSNLWLIKDGVIDYSNGDVEGDVVESWEVSPDKLTITAKINPNAHFAPVAPVNGRSVDAKDVVASWERHKAKSNQRADFDNEVNPAAPIVSMTAPDDKTVVIKLAEPNAVVQARLGRATPGSIFIIPKEALDTNVLNLDRTSIGTGAYYITDFKPSVGLTLKKNPGFKQDKRDLPYMDAAQVPDRPGVRDLPGAVQGRRDLRLHRHPRRGHPVDQEGRARARAHADLLHARVSSASASAWPTTRRSATSVCARPGC